MLKFFGPNCFQTLWWIWFTFGMMIDTGPEFYTVPSRIRIVYWWNAETTITHPHIWLLDQGHRHRTFMLKFYVKVFRTSLFPNPVVYLFHVWYDDRCWSKILCSMIPNPVHDFQVKVTDLEFLYWSLCLSFYNVCFCEAFDGLIHVWHGDRNWSKILYGTIPNPERHILRIFI